MRRFMTDFEYAVHIYRAVFPAEKDIGDIYLQGVLDTLDALPVRQLFALQYRFREGKSYAQVGKILGVTDVRVRQIILQTLQKLRKKQHKMCVSQVLEKCDALQKRLAEQKAAYDALQKHLEEQKAAYDALYEQTSRLFRGDCIDQNLQERLERQQIKIKDFGLSVHITNALAGAGIVDCEALLHTGYKELIKIRSIGSASLYRITRKMYEFGFTEWADGVRKEVQGRPDNFDD